MRTLSDSLLAAQRQESRTPYVRVEASNTVCGVVNLKWTRLYSGAEPDYFHAVTMLGDGSLIRVRITPPEDGRKLYRQRVTGPGPGSDFSQWNYLDQYNVLAIAACSSGTEVSIFWVKSNREIYHLKSIDCGASWGSPELIGYTVSTDIGGSAAAYKPGGDVALVYADQVNLHIKKRISGSWQDAVVWDKTTGDLSGVAMVYDGDWKLIVSGRETGGDFKVWSLIYGDGGEVSAGIWSALKAILSAPSDGDFEYYRVFMDKPDILRFFFVEKFSGTGSYSRPFWSHSIVDEPFLANLWREPVPFNLASEYGLAIAYHGDYCWLSSPGGVWRACFTQESLDLTADVVSAKVELSRSGGKLTVELNNDSGKYALPGQGVLSVLDTGCDIALSPGYVTSQGNEVSVGPTFVLQAYEHAGFAGRASLMLYAADAWQSLDGWVARQLYRWNKDTEELCVRELLALMLARAGIKLEVISQSAVVSGFYPDFTIQPGDRGSAVISRLLSFVPDVFFVEGGSAYLINPLAEDSPVYSFGGAHRINEGRYRTEAWKQNRTMVEGYDAGQAVVADCFAWNEIGRLYDRLVQIEDRNLDTIAGAQERGDAYLRQAEIASASGMVRSPVNCGQQLYDVVDITDAQVGLMAAKKRVLGLTVVYEPRRGVYEQRLLLGLP